MNTQSTHNKYHPLLAALLALLLCISPGLAGLVSAQPAQALFNNDRFADLAIGVPLEDIGAAENTGAVNILYGSSPGGLTSSGDAAWGQFGDPAETGDKFASALAVVDFNGDGLHDLAVGVPGETVNGHPDAGAINVMYGTAAGLTGTQVSFWHQDSDGVQGLAEDGDQLGFALAVGDFDGDGYDDIAAGMPYEDYNLVDAGIVHVFYGAAGGITGGRDQVFTQDVDGLGGVEEANDHFGYAVAAGDFNGDGYADLAIGCPDEDLEIFTLTNAGQVYILYGSSTGLTLASYQMWFQPDGASGNRYGQVLTSADFNGDGRDDLAVGIPEAKAGDPLLSRAGRVDVYQGSKNGIDWLTYQTLYSRSIEAQDQFGFALVGSDFNGDGFADLAVGSPYEDLVDIVDCGAVEILYGSSGALVQRVANDFWHQDRSGMESIAEANEHFGWALAAGDFNGDLYSDLAIGIPTQSINVAGDYAGAVHIMYGSASGITALNSWMVHQGLPEIEGLAEERDNFGKSLAAFPLKVHRIFTPIIMAP